MNKKFLLLGLFLAAVLLTVNVGKVNSNQSFPPAGSCGDPTTSKTCAQSTCHANASAAAANLFTFNIGTGTPTTEVTSSFKYTPGTTYNLAFLIDQAAVANPFYGFQMTALNNNNVMAGSFTAVGNTHLLTGTPQYIGHKLANSIRNWSFKWTAPANGGDVTFYYAFNICSYSVPNDPSPDMPEGNIYHGSVTIQSATGTGINDIESKLSDLNVFPNPVTQQFGLSFNLKENAEVSAQLYNMNGEVVSLLLNEELSSGICNRNFNVDNIAAGIYLVKLNVGDASVMRKIVKQ